MIFSEEIMKKERILLAFFIMPLFLLGASFRYLRLEGDKKPNFTLFKQQIKSQNENPVDRQNEVALTPDHGGAKSGLSLSEKSKESELETPEPEKHLRARTEGLKKPGNSGEKRPGPDFLGQIKFISRGQSFLKIRPLFQPDQVLVKFKLSFPEEMREATLSAYNFRKLKRIPGLDIYKLQIPENISVEEMLFLLRRNPDVEYAEPNYLRYITVTPNDTLRREQYALDNAGQEVGPPSRRQLGEKGADIKAYAAWEETKGEAEIIIAVIDTGVDLAHPDIKNKIYSSGRDFVNGDFDATDDHYHGTHVAGIAAAETNNNEGISGVAWNCKILPIKVVIVPVDPTEDPYAPDDLLIEGIMYAADHGADVINLSLGGEFPNSALEEALAYACEKNVVIVAAAGNDGTAVYYPAAYDNYCLAVAATNCNDERVTISISGEWESNYGPEIDVAAPGFDILSLIPTAQAGPGFLPYAWLSGTSMATPHVAGLAALIKSIKPRLTVADIMNVIRYSADDVNSIDHPGKDDYLGYGRINMEKALVPIVITPKQER